MASIRFLQDIDIDGNVLVSQAGNAELTLLRTSGAELTLSSQSNLGTLTTTNNFPLHLGTNGATRMAILTNGNIGIGVTTPSSFLEIANPTYSNATVLLGRQSGYPTIQGNGTSGGQWLMLDSNGGYLALNNHVTDNVVLAWGGGDVAVGNGSPLARFHVKGSGTTSATTALLVENSAGDDLLKIGDDGLAQLGKYGSGTFTGTAAYTLAVDASGNIIETSGGGSTPTLQEVTTAGNTTTDDVGIQVSNPVSALHIGDGNNTISSVLYSTDIVNVSAQNTAPGFNIISAGTSSFNRGVFKATRSRGTLASPSAAVSGDYVFSLLGAAYNGTSTPATAGIEMLIDGTVTPTLVPQRIEFQTSTGTNRSTRMTIKSNGDVKVGGGSPSAKFHILSKGTNSATTGLLLESNTGTDLLKVTDDGAVQLGAYGSGTFTGTAAYTLAVDASGNIIETSGGGGTPDLDAVTTVGNTTTNSITIGSATAGTAQLNIVGADTSVATDALLIENSGGSDLFKITNSGNFYMSSASRFASIVINNVDTVGTGNYSTIVGYQAGDGTNTNGLYMTAIGARAAQLTNGGTFSVAIGMNSARNAGSLSNAVVVGMNAVNNSGGFSNSVAVGRSAAEQSNLTTSTIVGYYAGRAMGTTQRSNNVYIGYNVASSSNNQSGNTFIGSNIQSSSTEALNNTVIIGSSSQERLRVSADGDVTWTGGNYMKIQTGTTASRPSSPVAGMIRFNTTTGKYEGYVDSITGWVNFH